MSSTNNFHTNPPEITLANIEVVLEYLKYLDFEDKSLLALDLIKKINELIESAPSDDEITKTAKALLEKESSRINRIISEANCTLTFLTELETKEGWELCKQDEGVTTWFKQLPDSPTYYIKIKGIVPSPIFHLLALVNEIDFYKKWIPTCYESKIDVHITDFKKIVHLKLLPPSPINWVISGRELVLYGFGVDMMEENKLAALARSPTAEELENLKNEFNYVPPPEDQGSVRMNCHLAGLLLERVDDNRTRVSVLSNSDPKVQLPYWVINFATKNLAHRIFSFLRAQAANLDDDYKKRIASSAAYERIRQKIKKDD